MWSVVSKISTEKKHSSVVLTTHSMEEAEALSTKLAIMVEGSIECIGSVQKLKNKYGKGFEVEVKIAVPNNEEVTQMQTSLGLRPDQPLDLKDVYGLFDRLSLADMKGEIKKGGALESIYSQVGNVNPRLSQQDPSRRHSSSTRLFYM